MVMRMIMVVTTSLSCYYEPGRHFTYIILFSPDTVSVVRESYGGHFTEENIEAYGAQAQCLVHNSWQLVFAM